MGIEQDPMWDYNVNETAKAMHAGISAVVKSMRNPTVIIGKAVNVTDLLCDIDRSEEKAPTIPGARLNALEGTTTTYATTVPKEGSWVLAALIEDDRTEAVVIATSEVEKVIWKCGENTTHLFTDGTIESKVGEKSIKVTATEILMNGGGNDGLLIDAKALENLNVIKTYLNTMKGAISSALGTVDIAAGSASAGTFNSTMSSASLDFVDMKNPDVKH